MKCLLRSRTGNSLVAVVVVSSLILGGIVITLQYIGLSIKTSVTSSQEAALKEADLSALNIIAQKLQPKKTDSNGVPQSEWVLEFYPTNEELSNPEFNPYFIGLTSAASSLVPNLVVSGSKDLGTGQC